MNEERSIFSFLVEGARRVFGLYPPLPLRIHLELTNICNFSCPMCQRKDFALPEREMSLEVFHRALAWFSSLSSLHEVQLFGWGEPLSHPHLMEIISAIKRRGLYLGVTTNGSLLKGRMADGFLASGIDEIVVSMEGIGEGEFGHPSGRVVAGNVSAFLKARGRSGAPRVTVRATLHRGGEDRLLELVRFAKEHGVDTINITRLDVRFKPDLRRPSPAEERAILKRVQMELAGSGTELACTYIGRGKGLRRMLFRAFKSLLHRGGRDCPKIFDYLYITVDGEVSPCCALPRYIVGDIESATAEGIWRGRNLAEFRRRQREVCGPCDVTSVKQRAHTHSPLA